MRQVKARYVLGLTATPVRKDGHHPIILMQCGPIRYRVSAKEQAASRPFQHVVIPRHTAFRIPETAERTEIHTIYAALVADELRNQVIVTDLLAPSGRPMIVHNRGWGPQLEDALFVDKITGHYRFTRFH